MAGIRDRKSKDAKSGSYRADNVELFSREIKSDTNSSDKIYSRDADNLYPLRIEKVINNSPTGRRCANLMAKYIAGKGNTSNFKIGKKYINDIISAASASISKQYGVSKASINAWTKKYREECSDKNSNAEYSLNNEIAQLKHQLAEKEKEILF